LEIPKKEVEFEIHRFNPQKNKSYVCRYKIIVQKGMTILEALNYIKDNLDESLSFRQSCRMGICGSCGVNINGKPELACHTQVLNLESNSLVIKPLTNFPIIKDLIVDIKPFFKKSAKVPSLLIKTEEQLQKTSEFIQTPTELKEFWDYTLCIKCSLCYSSCPAVLNKKFLGPSAYNANFRFISDSRDDGFKRRLNVIGDNIWSCTSCHSCTLCCPKEISLSNVLVDSKSNLIENMCSIPKAETDVLTRTVKWHNPMGLPPSKRKDWSGDLELEDISGEQEKNLCFIYCSTAYDVRNQEIARSIVHILKNIGYSFVFLKEKEEWCCGDHQLRLGEKGLFEMLAEHNLSVFNKHNIKTILTISPHCYNTFKNDEPYSVNEFEIKHYTELIADAPKLSLTKRIEKKVTYHDPCFLGKRNGIYDAPREILKSIPGLQFIEMERTKENSFCCGGGAGRVWTDDAVPEDRPSVSRIREALDLGIEVITTACPFCVITLEDAVKVLDVEDRIIVKDVSEILREAM
jgi:succinate dehydrogenase/fumarate reductase iron-sulfur protein